MAAGPWLTEYGQPLHGCPGYYIYIYSTRAMTVAARVLIPSIYRIPHLFPRRSFAVSGLNGLESGQESGQESGKIAVFYHFLNHFPAGMHAPTGLTCPEGSKKAVAFRLGKRLKLTSFLTSPASTNAPRGLTCPGGLRKEARNCQELTVKTVNSSQFSRTPSPRLYFLIPAQRHYGI